MTAKELFDLCTNPQTECNECPYKDKQAECFVVHNAIHMLRHPSWYVKDYHISNKNESTFVPSASKIRKVIEKDLPHRIFNVLDVKMINSFPYFLIYRFGEFVYVTANDFDLVED